MSEINTKAEGEVSHFESITKPIPKDTTEGDAALIFLSLYNQTHHEPLTDQETASLNRKVDWTILPFIGVAYAFFYIDTTTLMPPYSVFSKTLVYMAHNTIGYHQSSISDI